MIIGRTMQASRLRNWWYQPSQYYFIIFEKYQSECQNMSLSHCVKIAVNEFGKPLKSWHYDQALILVWHHPLVQIHHPPILKSML